MKKKEKIRVDTLESRLDPFIIILFILTLAVPLLVLPTLLDNAFSTPKMVLILIGASLMTGLYCFKFLCGKTIPKSETPLLKILPLLIGLNLFSFFYTSNYYYTAVAATMNITSLVIFYFVSVYIDEKKAFILFMVAAFSGLLVSVETWLQFFDIFLIFKWAYPGIMVMGTIGNSNHLGAYLIFPLFATISLMFLFKGKNRLIPLIVLIFIIRAFLFTRARAGWMGFFLAVPIFFLLLMKIYKIPAWRFIRSNPKKTFAYTIIFISALAFLWFGPPQRFRTMMEFGNVTRANTLLLRVEKYSQASFWLFKQSPLFGTGLWSFRNMVYTAQAEINKVDKTFFENYPEPKPREVHNEYLEILNDGGLVAAAALSLFFFVIMRHGWAVIKNEEIQSRERIITATAFSSIIAIMLTAFFFFPFRINSTLFMTVLMMGIMEALYLRNHKLLSRSTGWKSATRYFLAPTMILVLVGIVWFTGIKPFKGEMEYFRYRNALNQGKIKEAEEYISKALYYDPHNSAYCLYASQLYMNWLKDLGKARDYIETTIFEFNGDLTPWALYLMKGILSFQTGNLFGAKESFEQSLYYYPTFQEARLKLVEVNKVIKDHDRVLIKIR